MTSYWKCEAFHHHHELQTDMYSHTTWKYNWISLFIFHKFFSNLFPVVFAPQQNTRKSTNKWKCLRFKSRLRTLTICLPLHNMLFIPERILCFICIHCGCSVQLNIDYNIVAVTLHHDNMLMLIVRYLFNRYTPRKYHLNRND